jgi:hypothetical protein
MAIAFGTQTANAACQPSGPKPTNQELAKLIICLQKEIDTLPKPPTNPTDASAIHTGDNVALRFADQGWCIARGDQGDNKVYTLQCPPGGTPGQSNAHVTISK